MKKSLHGVTLLGVDCVDIERLILAAKICLKDFEFEDVKLLTSIRSEYPSIVPIEHISSVEQYSKFIIEKLDEYVASSHVLVIQYDGFILNPEAWSDVFLHYDYIGAPWLVRQSHINSMGWPAELLGSYLVGGGGFSLRSKKFLSLCADLARQNFFSTYHPEDTILCVDNREYFESAGIRFSPVPIAQQFSYEAEDMEKYTWDGQFGFHGLQWTDISKWTREHPEYKIDNTLRAVGKTIHISETVKSLNVAPLSRVRTSSHTASQQNQPLERVASFTYVRG